MDRTARREAMPTITKLFDDFAEVFGRKTIEAMQKERMADGTFYAREGDLSIGKPNPRAERSVTADEWLRQSELIATDPRINPSLCRPGRHGEEGETIAECAKRLRGEK